MNTPVERLTARGSPFEVVETRIAGVPCRVFCHAPRTLVDIYRRARSCGDRELLVSGTRRATYRDVFRLSGRIAEVIRATLGDPAGVRIAVILANVPEWIASFIAITATGGIAVTLHRTSPLSDIVSGIEMTDCRMALCNGEIAAALRRQVPGMRVVAIGSAGDATGDTRDVLRVDGCEGDGEVLSMGKDSVRPESLAMIAFTSGSTSRPKGVELTHRSMCCGMMNALLGGALAAARNASPGQGARGTSRLSPTPFLAGPFSHVSGYGTALLTLYVGGKMVTMAEWDAKGAADLMLSERATSLIGVSSGMLGEMLSRGEMGRLGDFLRSIMVQGAALPDRLLRELKAALPAVSIGVGYGLTETNGAVCMGSEAMLRERPSTVGRPLPTVDVMIRGDDGREAAPGELGEVTLRGAMLMRGYVNMLEETGKALRDGWLRTGDLGWMDGDGLLHLADRADHFIHSGVAKVSCSAVARIVVDKELATEAFAFGVAQDWRTEEALVVAVSGTRHSRATEAAIAEALRSSGYGSLALRIVRLAAPLPRTPSGKIDGREIQRRIGAGERAPE